MWAGWARLYIVSRVAHGGVGRPSQRTIDTMAAVASKRKSSSRWGIRLVNKNDKSNFGKSNGQKITTWPIKYPHIKKNAQHGNTPTLQGLQTVKY